MIDLPPEANALLEQARRDHNPSAHEAERVRRALYSRLGIAAALLPSALPAPAAAATSTSTAAAGTSAAGAGATAAAVTSAAGAGTTAVFSLKAGKILLAVVTLSGMASLPLVIKEQSKPASTHEVVATHAGRASQAGAVGGQAAARVPTARSLEPTVEPLAPSAPAPVAAVPSAAPSTRRAAPAEPAAGVRASGAAAAAAASAVDPTARAVARTTGPATPTTPTTPPAEATRLATRPPLPREPEPVARSRSASRDERRRRADEALPEVLGTATDVGRAEQLALPAAPTAAVHDAHDAHEVNEPDAVARAGRAPPAAEPAALAIPPDAEPEPDRPQELALIRGALISLRDGAPARALSLLGEHAVRYPRGAFASERRGLRVLALCAAGRLDEGRERRKVFLRDEGASPMAERVRNACQEVSHP